MEKLKNLATKEYAINIGLFFSLLIFVAGFTTLFGQENSLLGVSLGLILVTCTKIKTELSKRDTIITIIVTMVAMSLISYWSRFNPTIGFLLNFVTIFITTYLFSDKSNVKTYLPFVLSYVVMEGIPVDSTLLSKRVIAALIGGLLAAMVYHRYYKESKKHKYPANIDEFLNELPKNSERFNFALRLAMGVSIAMLIGTIFNFDKSMWISMTVVSMIQPRLKERKEKATQKAFGTILGSAMFLTLFNICLPERVSALALLGLGYMYAFVDNFKTKLIFITLNSLSYAMVLSDSTYSLSTRVIFVATGALIAFAINKIYYREKQAVVKNKKMTKLDMVKNSNVNSKKHNKRKKKSK